MIENVVGVMGLPLGMGLNFLINGKAYVVPLAVEEPSIVAALSASAKLAAAHGGFKASANRTRVDRAKSKSWTWPTWMPRSRR